MRKLITEPLVQFLLLGFVLYLLVTVFASGQLNTESSATIVVNDKVLQSYLQFQRKSFDSKKISAMFNSLNQEQRQTLTDSYVRDEALYRQALALGLDQQDDIIKRRLIQKMEYIAQGFYNDIQEISEDKLQIYFQQNIEQYEVSASISFTHVFVGGNTNSKRAEVLLHELNDMSVVFEGAGQYGDRFLYNLNYIERTPDYIESHFGLSFKESIFKLIRSRQWQGPIKSDHGYHLVLIKNSTASRMPDLQEVAEIVLADAQREQQQTIKTNAIAEIISQYQISLTNK